MATNFPTTLDSYTAVVDTVTDVLAVHVNDKGDAIVALETKVGINSSGVTTTLDYKVTQLIAGTGMSGSSQATAFIPTGSTVPTNGLYLPAANTLGLATASALRIAIGGSYMLDFGTGGAGGTAAIGGISNIGGYSNSGAYSIWGGRGSIDGAFIQLYGSTHATNANLFIIGTNSTSRLSVNSSGQFVLTAPSSGTTLTLTGASGNTGASIAVSNGGVGLNITGTGTTVNHITIAGPAATQMNVFTLQQSGQTTWTFYNPASTGDIIWYNGANVFTLKGNGEAIFAKAASTTPFSIGNSSTAFTVDFRNSNVQTLTMTGNVAAGGWTLSNPQDGQTMTLFITQDGTGSRTLGWPSSFKWPNGASGTITSTASAVSMLTLTYRSSTGFYYATLSTNMS